MWFRKRRAESEPPRGVRVRLDDGTVIPCGLVRDPDLDGDGLTGWMAAPVRALPFGAVPAALEMDVLPPKTTVDLRIQAVIPYRDEGSDG